MTGVHDHNSICRKQLLLYIRGAGDQVRVLCAVEPVSGQRTADVGHVDPELVGAARFWL